MHIDSVVQQSIQNQSFLRTGNPLIDALVISALLSLVNNFMTQFGKFIEKIIELIKHKFRHSATVTPKTIQKIKVYRYIKMMPYLDGDLTTEAHKSNNVFDDLQEYFKEHLIISKENNSSNCMDISFRCSYYKNYIEYIPENRAKNLIKFSNDSEVYYISVIYVTEVVEEGTEKEKKKVTNCYLIFI